MTDRAVVVVWDRWSGRRCSLPPAAIYQLHISADSGGAQLGKKPWLWGMLGILVPLRPVRAQLEGHVTRTELMPPRRGRWLAQTRRLRLSLRLRRSIKHRELIATSSSAAWGFTRRPRQGRRTWNQVKDGPKCTSRRNHLRKCVAKRQLNTTVPRTWHKPPVPHISYSTHKHHTRGAMFQSMATVPLDSLQFTFVKFPLCTRHTSLAPCNVNEPSTGSSDAMKNMVAGTSLVQYSRRSMKAKCRLARQQYELLAGYLTEEAKRVASC